MATHPDVLLYLLFESIRGDWTQGIGIRGASILELLPDTNFTQKEEMRTHIINMLTAWESESRSREFDGRHWTTGKYCYYTLFYYFSTLDNLNSTNYLRWGVGESGTKRLESNWQNITATHDEVMELYWAYEESKRK